jgi:hypothetical protein
MFLMAYQIFGIFVGIVALVFTFIRFKEGKMSLSMLFVWSAIWLIIILISIQPTITSSLATITGIGRGLDLFLILGLIGSFYLIFKIYNMIEGMQEDISKLVREIAIQNGEIDKKIDQLIRENEEKTPKKSQ